MSRDGIITVPLERLTRYYLVRQHLLRRTDKSDIVAVAGSVCGLHAQLPLTPCYSLWNRMEGFSAEQLDRALYQHRSLVKTWFMRGTLHIIPTNHLPVYHHALKRMWFEHHGRYMNRPDWPPRETRENAIYPRIVEALTEKPLRRKELNDKVRMLLGDAAQPYARLFSAWGGILKETSYSGLTIYAKPCGKEACFAKLDQWLPKVNLSATDEKRARSDLLRTYLRCYGPASPQDFACWSGLPASEATTTFRNETALQKVCVEKAGKILWMLAKDLDDLLGLDLEKEAPPRLLPKYDPYLMGHKDRTRIIAPEHLRQVYRPVVGEVAATILINGRIAATWTTRKTRKTLTISVRPIEMTKNGAKEIQQEAEHLGSFMGIEHVGIEVSR